MRDHWAIALLAVGAAAGSLLPLHPFFGAHWQLGSIATVFAVLRFGWWGVLVGAAEALAETWTQGPWCIPVVLLEVVWLKLFLDRLNNGRRNADNGRIILADVGFWLIAGIPIILLFHILLPNLSSVDGLTQALVQSVNNVVNTTIGFTLYLLVKFRYPGKIVVKGISIRGLSMSIVLLAIAIPTFAVSSLLAGNLQLSLQQKERHMLSLLANRAITMSNQEFAFLQRALPDGVERMEVRIRRSNGEILATDSQLFDTLNQGYEPFKQAILPREDLMLKIPRNRQPWRRRLEQGYWIYEASLGNHQSRQTSTRITVAYAAAETIQALQRQTTQTVSLMAWVILIGALLSHWLGRSLDQQFVKVLAPIFRHQARQGSGKASLYAVPSLATSVILELNAMVKLINSRLVRVNRLNRELEEMNIELERSRQELHHLSTTDPLTGCYNRRELIRRLKEEIARADRQEGELSYLCFDIDFFKRVNDTYGHAMGDAVLVNVADAIRSRLRATDCFCRSGGEEFTILLPNCSSEAGLNYAELQRLGVADTVTTLDGTAVQVTISLGLSTYRPDQDDAEALMARADAALYASKENGRNQVTLG
ncbi:GGDEF domain-containing protein [Synechococcus sp. CS-1328]|uniref:GGDEF domain-containing protein n=1 Tax=Synechococcus sp. CS-1328 TaxID=2847976 RepID=UPI00223BDA7F|nr:GGDEF domain-containing protein [Synechococcus sp. CS-1328]MCT0225220.1 GGDEF domain-containing protein [Synechococcus sp. CS-1328]